MNPNRNPTAQAATGGGFWQRLLSLIRKETRQLVRDRSNWLVGLGLPIFLILLFGYGLTLDVRNVQLVVAQDDRGQTAHDIVATLTASPFIQVQRAGSQAEARERLLAHRAEALLYFPPGFSSEASKGTANVQLLLQGGDPIRAKAIQGYVEGAVAISMQKHADHLGLSGTNAAKGVVVIDRVWFNAANSSTWYLVPGLIVLIMTLVGTFLTAMVMAREWERGTLEAMFVTPVRPVELLLAKIVPYFFVGMAGLLMCLVAARVLFNVPVQGSLLILLLASMLYMVVSLATGLLVSSVTKNQFLASQLALLVSFMPAMMLSGFIFDLRNVPVVVRVVGHMLPATYFMELLRTLFLAGNQWGLIVKDCLILTGYAVLLLALAHRTTRKRLD
ncbi:MAG: ABC transporter permease [Brachymonas sp.]|nr:ABC transporter permease [Brachymonas sp.]